jgi:hypothetical protein
VIQYILFLSTWYQSTGSESPIYFILFLWPLPGNFPAPPPLLPQFYFSCLKVI